MYEHNPYSMKDKCLIRILLSVFLPLVVTIVADAQSVNVYKQIPSCQIKAFASSSIGSSPASNAVDGSGMLGDCHVANNLGEGMWVSEVSSSEVRYRPDTRSGAVWFVCELGPGPVSVDQLRIWNHNQNEHTRRGLKKVYIEYSADGESWNLLKDGEKEWYLIPESVGRNPEPADFVLDTPGMKARFVCVTAFSGGEGNHYDMNNSIIVRETADMHQNPGYFGLAEIRFYSIGREKVSALDRVKNITFEPSQGYLKTPDGPSREFFITFDTPLYAGAELEFRNGGRVWGAKIAPSAEGVSRYDGLFPAGYMDETSELTVKMKGGQGCLEASFEVPAARKWVVSFLPHSHLDIGYTHRQNDVMKLQWRNLERAVELAKRTSDYPEGARYCWNTEATWPIAAYLEEYAGTEKAENMLRAVKEGVINVDGSLGSILSGISRQEELMHYFDGAHRIEELTGVRITTAMMSDVPGQAWGLVSAMAKNGIRYYSPGPNYVPFYGKIGNDRAAAIHIKWGDRPFWWQSQSGTDKVLVWSAGRGYSWFHGWLAGRLSVCGLEPIWRYLTELEYDEFPYHTCYLRYTVHGDNGPPDELMPEVIRKWNEMYDSPQFRISTTTEFFADFEKEYGESLPSYGGDMTPTWEDGAASTMRETIANRKSASRLALSEILWSMLKGGKGFPASEFSKAWENVVLFSEHTWGAAGSGPEPDSKFTKDLWAGKKMYADSADAQSRRLYSEVLETVAGGKEYIHVLNANLWDRTDAVTVEADLSGMELLDQSGHPVPVQRLSDGRWIFVAKKVPAMSSAVYMVRPVSVKKEKRTVGKDFCSMAKGPCVLDNGIVRVVLDRDKGTIASFKMQGDDFEYVSGDGLNDWHYSDRLADECHGVDNVNEIVLVEDGPVCATLRVVSGAPGCNSLTRDVTIYSGLERVDVVNTVDKKDIRDFENARFVFPFNFPHPEITMDMAMSEMHPERDQLAGVNKNYYCVQNGISVGDLEHGICLTSVDAPFVELGAPSGLDYRKNPHHGYGWWQSSVLSPVIYSWVMTNTWRTNYKASQDGIAVFRYSLQPGDPHDLKLKQRGLEREQEMVAVAGASHEPVGCLFRLRGRHRISVSSIVPSKDGKGYVVRLQNMGGEPVNTGFVWGTLKGESVCECDWREVSLCEVDPDSFWLSPFEYKVLKINTNEN